MCFLYGYHGIKRIIRKVNECLLLAMSKYHSGKKCWLNVVFNTKLRLSRLMMKKVHVECKLNANFFMYKESRLYVLTKCNFFFYRVLLQSFGKQNSE